MSAPNCPLCSLESSSVFFEAEEIIGSWSAVPSAPGHAIILPRRHLHTWFDATQSERIAMSDGLVRARDEALRHYNPTGWNVSMELPADGGARSEHLHMHLIPRYEHSAPELEGGATGAGHLITGDEHNPLLRALLPLLDNARQVDVAVAFIQPSGLELLEPLFRQFVALHASHRLRIVTGDSLGVTDPDALARLLDISEGWPGRVQLRVLYRPTL